MKKENMAAYVAGFFDGEGSVFITKQIRADGRTIHHLRFALVNTSKDGMNKIARFLCVPLRARAYGSNNRVRYDIRLSGKLGLSCLSRIVPYLVIKKKQFILANAFERRLKYGRRKMVSKEISKRDEIMELMRKLNGVSRAS